MYSVIYNFLKQTVHDKKLLSIKIDFVNIYFLKANMHKLFFKKTFVKKYILKICNTSVFPITFFLQAS